MLSNFHSPLLLFPFFFDEHYEPLVCALALLSQRLFHHILSVTSLFPLLLLLAAQSSSENRNFFNAFLRHYFFSSLYSLASASFSCLHQILTNPIMSTTISHSFFLYQFLKFFFIFKTYIVHFSHRKKNRTQYKLD